jgi:hypothetical protein
LVACSKTTRALTEASDIPVLVKIEQRFHWSDSSRITLHLLCFTSLQVDVVLDANNLPITYTCPDNSKFVEVGAAAAFEQ